MDLAQGYCPRVQLLIGIASKVRTWKGFRWKVCGVVADREIEGSC